MLWFGWNGFNAGSELASNARAVNAFLVTNIAASISMATWMVCEYMLTKKINPIGAACGAIAGLVAITPSCGFVEPIYALVIGFGS